MQSPITCIFRLLKFTTRHRFIYPKYLGYTNLYVATSMKSCAHVYIVNLCSMMLSSLSLKVAKWQNSTKTSVHLWTNKWNLVVTQRSHQCIANNVGEAFLREKIQFLMILPIELPIFYHTHIPYSRKVCQTKTIQQNYSEVDVLIRQMLYNAWNNLIASINYPPPFNRFRHIYRASVTLALSMFNFRSVFQKIQTVLSRVAKILKYE